MAYDRRNGGFMNGIGRKIKIKGNPIVGNKSGNNIKMGFNNTRKIKNNVDVNKLCLEGTAVTNSSPMLRNCLFVVVVVTVAVAAVLTLVLSGFLAVYSDHLFRAGLLIFIAVLLIVAAILFWRYMDHECRQSHPRPQQRQQNHHREDQKDHKHLKYRRWQCLIQYRRWQCPESDGHKPRQKIDRNGIPYRRSIKHMLSGHKWWVGVYAHHSILLRPKSKSNSGHIYPPFIYGAIAWILLTAGFPYLPCYRALNEIECVEIEDVDSDEESEGF